MKENFDLRISAVEARLKSQNEIIEKLQLENKMLRNINQISIEENEKLIAISSFQKSHEFKRENLTQVDIREGSKHKIRNSINRQIRPSRVIKNKVYIRNVI